MKKIISLFKKLQKIPAIIFVIAGAASYLFANLYSFRVEFANFIETLGSYAGATGLPNPYTNINSGFFYVLTSLVGVAFFEIVLHFIYRSMYLRLHANSNIKYFKAVARVMFVLSNVIVGLYSLIYFKAPVLYAYGSYLLNFVVYTAAYSFAYLVVSQDVINPRYVGQAFMRLFTIYFVLLGVISLLELTLVIGNNSGGYVLHSLRVGIIVVSGVAVYLTIGKKMKLREKNYVEPPRPEDKPPLPPDEIYKGYGF